MAMIDCPACSSSFSWNPSTPKVCKYCGASVPEIEEKSTPAHIKAAIEGSDFSGLTPEEIETYGATEQALQSVILTTTPYIPGVDSFDIVDVIATETALGMNVFRDLKVDFTDVFGGRSGTTQQILREVRTKCLKELRREALSLGAKAVIGVSLTFSEFSGSGRSMLFAVACGTAIKYGDKGE